MSSECRETLDPQLWESLSNTPVECPECGKISDSIKCYKLPKLLVFVLVYGYASTQNYIGCKKCIRKRIFLNGFTYNIITGNFLWLFFLPWMIIQLLRSFTNGHSREIKEILFDNHYNNKESE